MHARLKPTGMNEERESRPQRALHNLLQHAQRTAQAAQRRGCAKAQGGERRVRVKSRKRRVCVCVCVCIMCIMHRSLCMQTTGAISLVCMRLSPQPLSRAASPTPARYGELARA